MTPPELAARVAALLDAGLLGHVRDLYEDMTADLGEAEAVRLTRNTLTDYRFSCISSGRLGIPGHLGARDLYDQICRGREAPRPQPRGTQ